MNSTLLRTKKTQSFMISRLCTLTKRNRMTIRGLKKNLESLEKSLNSLVNVSLCPFIIVEQRNKVATFIKNHNRDSSAD